MQNNKFWLYHPPYPPSREETTTEVILPLRIIAKRAIPRGDFNISYIELTLKEIVGQARNDE